MTLKLVSRAQWGARPPKYINRGNLSAESTCHWNGPTVTVGGKTTWDHSKCAGLVRGIQNFHMDSKGWSDVAYNFLECPHGYTFQGRGLNVINGANGTNTGNRTSHAICCLAGEGNPFPETEKVGFKEAVAHIDANTQAPGSCQGHRDHKSTACPGNARYDWVHRGMPLISVPTPTPPPVPIVKKGRKMDSFLFRLTKEPHVWLVANTLVEKSWVENRAQLDGFKALLKANGLSPDVCSLDSDDPMAVAIMSIDAVGKVYEGYTGPKR